MTIPAMHTFDGQRKERRRYARVELALSGRYMLRDRREYPCWTLNISPGGIAILGLEKGMIGEPVIAYIEGIGRVEGLIARNFDRCFAMAVQMTAARREKLGQTLDWLVRQKTRGGADNRRRERIIPFRKRTTLTLADGIERQAAVIDLSPEGVALEVDVKPPIGAPARVGRRPGLIVRHLPGGVAVNFDEPLPSATFNEGAKL